MQPSDSDLVEGADDPEAAVVSQLLEPLARLARGSYSEKDEDEDKEETPLNRQLAMLALRSFARRFGARDLKTFLETGLLHNFVLTSSLQITGCYFGFLLRDLVSQLSVFLFDTPQQSLKT